jgi:hypothetical protein
MAASPDPHSPADPEPSADETRRRAADLWYERFERKRDPERSPRRQALVRLGLIAAAIALLVLGVRLRSDRMDEVLGGKDPQATLDAAGWAARLSRELRLDGAEGAQFFPLWESWIRGVADRRRARSEAQLRLDELSAQRNDHNSSVAYTAEELLALDSLDLRARQQLLREVREGLGPWRSARLQLLLEEHGR